MHLLTTPLLYTCILYPKQGPATQSTSVCRFHLPLMCIYFSKRETFSIVGPLLCKQEWIAVSDKVTKWQHWNTQVDRLAQTQHTLKWPGDHNNSDHLNSLQSSAGKSRIFITLSCAAQLNICADQTHSCHFSIILNHGNTIQEDLQEHNETPKHCLCCSWGKMSPYMLCLKTVFIFNSL